MGEVVGIKSFVKWLCHLAISAIPPKSYLHFCSNLSHYDYADEENKVRQNISDEKFVEMVLYDLHEYLAIKTLIRRATSRRQSIPDR